MGIVASWMTTENTTHIAVATVHELDYLLTWNCKHIANAQIQRKLVQQGKSKK